MKTLGYARREVARLTVDRAVADATRPDAVAIDDQALLRLEVGGAVTTALVPPGAVPDAAATVAWPRVVAEPLHMVQTGETSFELARISVEVRDPRARSLDWEGWLASAIGAAVRPIRSVPVPPRVRQHPMAFPLHVLVIGDARSPLGPLAQLFGYGRFDTAFVVASDPAASSLTAPPATTIDIVHLSLAQAAGWLDDRPERAARQVERLISRWTTRLLILEDAPPAAPTMPRSRVREVAQALAERGGPAVLLVDRNDHQCRELYAGLVHDQPLDVIVAAMRPSGGAELVGGSGREDLVRISSIATALPALVDWLAGQLGPDGEGAPSGLESVPRPGPVSRTFDPPAERTYGAPASRGYEPPFPRTTEPSALPGAGPEGLRGTLEAARQELAGLTFDHETTGALPSSRAARALQDVYRTIRAADDSAQPAAADGERTVNARLAAARDDGPSKPLDPRAVRLAPGEPVRLEIDIAVPDPTLPRVGPLAFIEKLVDFEPGRSDTVLEIGVTGIDFAVLGSPIQELRLPRRGASETVAFALVPTAAPPIAGVARLRVCVYHRNNLIQSYRLAAALDATPVLPLAKALALALDVDDAAIAPDIAGGYLTRLEYSAFGCDQADQAPPRELSFFVNDSAGANVVTAKGNDLFCARILPELPDAVERCRAALKAISQRPGLLHPTYAFDPPASPEEWSTAMAELAHKGWLLYCQLVPEEVQRDVAEAVSGAGVVVHAAHHDVEHVLPWNLLYMRPYDAGRTAIGDRPVLRGVCPAGMPAADGALDDARCGERADCLLHATRVAAARAGTGPIPLPQTIACPRQFWGFRHVIEVPVQQVTARPTPSRDTALATLPTRAVVSQVRRRGPARVMVGYNATLALAGAHLIELADRMAKAGAEVPFAPPPTCKRDAILDELETAGSQIIYFYTHARPSLTARDGRPLLGPHLEFEDFPDASGRLEPDNVAGLTLASQPLVFLNGCSTVGFSASAPSRFIARFVACGAVAVVGTETTVWEQLAGPMAIGFLERFLSGQSAGEALLGVRRKLLAERNPLGLIYTLYGPAQLQLVEDT